MDNQLSDLKHEIDDIASMVSVCRMAATPDNADGISELQKVLLVVDNKLTDLSEKIYELEEKQNS